MPIPPFVSTPRAAIMVVFAAFGSAVGALSGSIPTVTRAAGVGSLSLGLAITLSTVATVAVMSIGGTLGQLFDGRTALLWALPAFGLAVALLLTSASAGVLVMAMLSSAVSTQVGPWATAAVIGICFAMSWELVRRIIVARPLAAGTASRISSLPNKTPLLLLGLAAGLIISGEMAALMWSASFSMRRLRTSRPSPGLALHSSGCATPWCASMATVCVRTSATCR